jgi:hypothetical protein
MTLLENLIPVKRDILNVIRELSRYCMIATRAMSRVMTYCVDVEDTGVVIKPKGK